MLKPIPYKIILASNSPRRRELLAGLGLDFEVHVIKGISEDSSIQDIIAGSAPFAFIMVLEIALLCFFPGIATWLPSVLK